MQRADIHRTMVAADRSGQREMRSVVIASIRVLGFISFSPTYQTVSIHPVHTSNKPDLAIFKTAACVPGLLREIVDEYG